MKYQKYFLFIALTLLPYLLLSQQISFKKYHSPKEVNGILEDFSKQKNVKLHNLTKDNAGHTLSLIEIGTGEKILGKPAVLVTGNMEGDVPLSTEAALFLIDHLLKNPKLYSDRTWYIMPILSYEAAERFFKKPLRQDTRNFTKHNDDLDENIDEDDYEDLNGDGYITEMRVKDPLGEWIPSETDPRILRKANNEKGEKGIYKLYSEGIDNDNDGLYNEDPIGGVNVGCNFPQFFRHFTNTDGEWPGSEPESKSMMKFVNEHKNIAMVIVFGSTNICLNKPYNGRKGDADLSRISIPRRYADMLNADPAQTYSMAEVIAMAKNVFPPGEDVTESTIMEMLGLGGLNNPTPEDMKFYEELSLKYKEFLKTAKLDGKRLESEKEKDGSFEIYSYFQLGLPTFSMDFWTIPETVTDKKDSSLSLEKIEKMKNDEFLSLGKEKIEKLIKDLSLPKSYTFEQISDLLKSGKTDLKKFVEIIKKSTVKKEPETNDIKIKSLLAFSDRNGKYAFKDWTPFKHPQLGDVEIGGVVPYSYNTPADSMIDRLISAQVPWVFELADKLPKIKISKVESLSKGNGIYEIKAYIENVGYLPYPTNAGVRINKILPVILTFDNQTIKILEGKKRTLIKRIAGNTTVMAKWLIQSDKPIKLKLSAETYMAYSDTYEFQLGEK